jgi:lysophospholipase L1-like esterase
MRTSSFLLIVFAALISCTNQPPRTLTSPERWVGAWMTALLAPSEPEKFDHQTLRMIVHPSLGSNKIRLRFSNLYGKVAIRLGSVHIAKVHTNEKTWPETTGAVTFSGMPSVEIAAGQSVTSDSMTFPTVAFENLAVSVYFDGAYEATTAHTVAVQTNYISARGDFSASESIPILKTISSWYLLSDVEVNSENAQALVAFGDSITDGVQIKRDSNHRWPDLLARRMQNRDGHAWSVLNAGLSGNRLLKSIYGNGDAAVTRTDRDIFDKSGVGAAIVLIGINDIGQPRKNTPSDKFVTATEVTDGLRKLAEQGHAKHVKMFIGTLLPFAVSGNNYYTSEKEKTRLQVNDWIRANRDFDAIIDFDSALRDPKRPSHLLPAYDSGDHLHPNDIGAEAIANAIDLALFQ